MRKVLFLFIVFFVLSSAYAQQWQESTSNYGYNVDVSRSGFSMLNDTIGVFRSYGYTKPSYDGQGNVGDNSLVVQFEKSEVRSLVGIDSIYVDFYLLSDTANVSFISPQLGFYSKSANTTWTIAGRDETRNYTAFGFQANDLGFHRMIYYGWTVPSFLGIQSYDKQLLNIAVYPLHIDSAMYYVSAVIAIGKTTFFYTGSNGSDSVFTELPRITGVGRVFTPPRDFGLSQNYPNPFNPSTRIEYTIATAGEVKLSVYNALGQEVATLADGYQPAGSHAVTFDASHLASGTYFYILTSGSNRIVKKMVLLK